MIEELEELKTELPKAEFPSAWLAQTSSIEVDVGCHRGTFVVAMAELYPETRFLGIERQRGRVERCLHKIGRLALANAHVVQSEGLTALREAGLRASVIHVSFPDPWPKRRHHIRRMVNRDFLKEAWDLLEPGGSLRLMTDDESYGRAMTEAASGFPGFRSEDWDDGKEYPATEFQKKFVDLPIYRLALRRVDAPAA